MSDTLKKIEQELDAPIPRSVVRERDGGGGRKLSYLEGHYVIDRLNKIFGPLNWDKEIMEIKEVVNKTSRGEFPAYLAKVRLTVSTGEGARYCSKEAYGYGADKSSQSAHELAIKEAVTDALKVAAKDLGMSLGLALYDRTQENVVEDEDVPVSSKESKSPAAAKDDAPVAHKTSGVGAAGKVEEAIRSYVRVADKTKKLSTEQFKEHMKNTYGVEKLASLTRAQLDQTLEYIKGVVA